MIGEEVKDQLKYIEGILFDKVVVCVGGGSNVIGMFQVFLDEDVELIGVEVVGKGIDIFFYVVIMLKGIVGVIYGLLIYLI